MKKLIIFCAVLLSAASFTSCENTPKDQFCWEIYTRIFTWGNEGPTQENTQYFWGTKTDVQEQVKNMEEQLKASGQEYYIIKFEPTDKTQADCH